MKDASGMSRWIRALTAIAIGMFPRQYRESHARELAGLVDDRLFELRTRRGRFAWATVVCILKLGGSGLLQRLSAVSDSIGRLGSRTAAFLSSGYHLKLLTRHPVRSVLSVAFVAIGAGPVIGSMALLESASNAPLPYWQSDQLVIGGTELPRHNLRLGVSLEQYQYLAESEIFSEIALYSPAFLITLERPDSSSLTIRAAFATPNLAKMLTGDADLTIVPSPDGVTGALISEALAAELSLTGRGGAERITAVGREAVVPEVLPGDFRLPQELLGQPAVELLLPFSAEQIQQDDGLHHHFVARLADSARSGEAASQLVAAARKQAGDNSFSREFGARVVPLRSYVAGSAGKDFRAAKRSAILLAALSVISFGVFQILSFNANEARRRVSAMLGASRGRLIATDSLRLVVLGAVGFGLAVVVGYLFVKVVSSGATFLTLPSTEIPLHLLGSGLAWTLAICLACGWFPWIMAGGQSLISKIEAPGVGRISSSGAGFALTAIGTVFLVAANAAFP